MDTSMEAWTLPFYLSSDFFDVAPSASHRSVVTPEDPAIQRQALHWYSVPVPVVNLAEAALVGRQKQQPEACDMIERVLCS